MTGDLLEAVEALLDEDLAPDQRQALARILSADPALARDFVRELQQAQLLRLAFAADSPQALGDAVIAQLAAQLTPQRVQLAEAIQQRIQQREAERRRPQPRRRSNRPRSRRPSLLPAAVAAAILLLLGGAWLALRQDPPVPAPRTAAAGGGVQVLAVEGRVLEVLNSDARPLQAQDRLRLGAEIRAEADARISLRLEDGSRLSALGGSRWRLLEDGDLLEIHRGRVEAEVRPRGQRPLRLRSELALATVLGTRLAITVEPASTRLDVAAGRVRLAHRQLDSSLVVAGGQWCIARPGQALLLEPRSDPVQPPAVLAPDGPTAPTFSASAVDLIAGPPPQPPAGELGRVFRETLDQRAVLALPNAGEGVTLRLPLDDSGPWRLWLEWRDDDEGQIAFSLFQGADRLLEVSGRGQGKAWSWAQADVAGPRPVELRLVAEVDGLPAVDDRSHEHPYRSVVRIGAIAIERLEEPARDPGSQR